MFLKKIKKFDGTRSICLFGIPVFSYKKSNSKCLSYLSKLGRVCDSSEYARSLGVTVGKNVQFVIHPYPFSFPDFGSEPYLIEIGDNVVVSFGVSFLTHDGAWYNCSKYINSSEIIAAAKQEASQLKEKASKDVEQERQKVMNEIKNEISNIAILAASKVIEKDIDSKKHKELIDNFIKEVGESK